MLKLSISLPSDWLAYLENNDHLLGNTLHLLHLLRSRSHRNTENRNKINETRQESSMIHSASTQSRQLQSLCSLELFFVFSRLWIMGTDGRTDNMCENSDHCRAWLWVGHVDQFKRRNKWWIFLPVRQKGHFDILDPRGRPQSRPAVITSFTQVVRPSVCTKPSKPSGMAAWIIDWRLYHESVPLDLPLRSDSPYRIAHLDLAMSEQELDGRWSSRKAAWRRRVLKAWSSSSGWSNDTSDSRAL